MARALLVAAILALAAETHASTGVDFAAGVVPHGVRPPAIVAPPRLSAPWISVYRLEEGGADARVSSYGSCDSSCDLSRGASSVTNTMHEVREGNASNSFSDSTSDELSCATCTALDRSSTTTWGGWVQDTELDPSDFPDWVIDKVSANTGYGLVLRWNPTDWRLEACCAVGTTEACGTTNVSLSWAHILCEFDDSADTLKLYVNYLQDGSTATVSSMSGNTKSFGLGNGGFSGRMDEILVGPVVLSAAERCLLCSCGADPAASGAGNAGCLCNGDEWVNTGRNGTCGSCSLPAKCARGR